MLCGARELALDVKTPWPRDPTTVYKKYSNPSCRLHCGEEGSLRTNRFLRFLQHGPSRKPVFGEKAYVGQRVATQEENCTVSRRSDVCQPSTNTR